VTRRPLLTFLILLAPLCAHAHTTRLSGAEITVSGHEAQVALILNGADLDAALGTTLTDSGGKVSATRLRMSQDAVIAYVTERARISNSGGGVCFHTRHAVTADAEHVKVSLLWICPPMTGALVYHSTLFSEIDPATRQMVTVKGEASRLALLSAASPRVTLAPTEMRFGDVFLHYLLAGVEHIAIGYDHIAFLVAVILWGRRLWPLVGVVTAFTVAHSLTLSLAVLGVVTPPQQLVEIAIALSIVYVAAENFFVHDLGRRWIVTFVFGLVHGFGFAAVLREYGIPRDALVPALAAFNIGVEMGQIAIVAAALFLLHLIESRVRALQPAPSQRLVYPVSGLVLLLALYWTAQRIFFQ
jgi:hydrogenase/urease accessory protein HupE